jgi:hypothetical protein
MRISTLLFGLVAVLSSLSQGAEARAVIRRVYHGNDFRGFYLDPPYWRYYPRQSCHSENSHWLYENHQYVFIEIMINDAGGL